MTEIIRLPKPKDHSALLKNIPKGDWVLLSADQEKLLAHGPDLSAAFQTAKDSGEEAPFVTRVPNMEGIFLSL